jgi:hypothetical protein
VPDTRHEEALRLAEELLSDIEYTKIGPSDIARKASRLARLTDDVEAMAWLRFEIAGYTKPAQGFFTDDEVKAAERSGRFMNLSEAGGRLYKIESIGEIQAHIGAAEASLTALGGSAAAGDHALLVEASRRDQRYGAWTRIAAERGFLDAILGAIHEYVAERYQELRFGSTVESAFEAVRAEVDTTIADLVPNALPRLTAAFENVTSASPEHWANAASTCRRLLKEVADAIRPPGPDVAGRKMGEDQYINRLVDWIAQQSASKTLTDVVTADLEHLGTRLDAVADAGHKGAHIDVSQFDAARYLIGTYLLLGDILRLGTPRVVADDSTSTASGSEPEDLPSPLAPMGPDSGESA